jgi:low temperature requirement protein LtrA
MISAGAMRGRDPNEAHRTSTPLELLFDLCFVVAVAQAAGQLHHALGSGHLAPGLLTYAVTFFAIWWAWMNFTWFASAYDTDDVPYRALTLVQMAGVLVLAAGVPASAGHDDLTVITAGYVIMRIAVVGQWLRAAAQHADGRPAALRYAGGVTVVQLGWVLRLLLPEHYQHVTIALLVAAELVVPMWAESRGRATSWHPGHIAERYGGFTIIVFGEVIAAVLVAVQQSLSDHGASASLIAIAVGGLVIVFGLWWLYFGGDAVIPPSLRVALSWGYGHYIVFAAAAALGAGLHLAVDTAAHHAHTDSRTAALAVAVPVAAVLVTVAVLHRIAGVSDVGHPLAIASAAGAVLGCALLTPWLDAGGAICTIAGVVTATLIVKLAVAQRRRAAPDTQP